MLIIFLEFYHVQPSHFSGLSVLRNNVINYVSFLKWARRIMMTWKSISVEIVKYFVVAFLKVRGQQIDSEGKEGLKAPG